MAFASGLVQGRNHIAIRSMGAGICRMGVFQRHDAGCRDDGYRWNSGVACECRRCADAVSLPDGRREHAVGVDMFSQ